MYVERRSKAACSTAQTQLKIDRQRRDFHFKVAHLYTRLYGLIGVEHVNIMGMVKNHMCQKVFWTRAAQHS